MVTSRVECAINSCITRRWVSLGSRRMVWNVVTTGIFSSRTSASRWRPGGPAVNPKLVLDADDIHIADVEEVRRALVGREILLFYFETHDAGILVPLLDIIDRHSKALALGVLRRHRGEQVGREGGDSTLAREVVAEKGDLANFRFCFHELVYIIRPQRDTCCLYPGMIRVSGQNCS